MKNVRFLNYDCKVTLEEYRGGGPAICLTIAETGEPMAHATVNVPGVVLRKGQVVIKNWAENQGILEALVEAGVVEDTGRTVWVSGYVEGNVCKVISETAHHA